MGTTPAPQLNDGDISWVLCSSALVLAMTAPGLALFYGGMVRRKNVNSILMQCFMCLAIVSVLWVVIGYSLAFGPGHGWIGQFVGGLDWFMLHNVSMYQPEHWSPDPKWDPTTSYGSTVPNQVYMIFQCMFAVITPALVIGSFAERVKFSAWVWFTVIWLLVVYCPVAHMVWSHDGIENHWGVLDFAGGTVVHMNAGIAGLATALYLGKRIGTDKQGMHNVPFVMIGASLLWFGWFGFNAGSAGAANGRAAMAMTVTMVAAAMAALSWMTVEWRIKGKPSVLGTITGAISGLVAITPASGYVDTVGALIIGALGGAICFMSASFIKEKFHLIDDSLDCFGIHGIGGILGAILTGVFAKASISGTTSQSGAIDGNPGQILIQLQGIGWTIGWCALATLVILFIVDRTIGLRVPEAVERDGLDVALHGETLQR